MRWRLLRIFYSMTNSESEAPLRPRPCARAAAATHLRRGRSAKNRNEVRGQLEIGDNELRTSRATICFY